MERIIVSFFVLALSVVFLLLKLWFMGSLLTSAVKAVANKCNDTYVVERLVDGHWFCPEVK